MLAKLTTYSLFGIEALPGRGRSRYLARSHAQNHPRRPGRGGRQREHRTASSGRWSTAAISGPSTASSSICRRPTCPKRPRRSICRSRSGCWRQRAARLRRALPRMRPSANWRSTARVRPTKGILSMAMAARQQGKRGLIVPAENAQEGAVVEGLEIIAVGSLAEAVGFYTEQLDIRADPLRMGAGPAHLRPTTGSTTPTSKARRWPSGPSPSPRPASIIC